MIPKKSIQSLQGYQANEVPYEIKLDANESRNYLLLNEFKLQDLELNRYPNNQASALINKISETIGVEPSLILEGNGSSELLELLVKTYVDKGETILSFEPSFSMYRIYSQIYSTAYVAVKSNDDFSVCIDEMINEAIKYNPKLIFLCTPNNPTGYLMPKEDIIKLLNNTTALVVVDEAYMEFTDESSTMIQETERYQNLVVLRTMSKAFGLAGIRVGYMVGNSTIITTLNKVKSPYHLNALSQYVAVQAFEKLDAVKQHCLEIQKLRSFLEKELDLLGFVIYPSYGNFVFVQSEIVQLETRLRYKRVLIRGFSGDLSTFYRITVGTQQENEILLQRLKEIINENINGN